MIAGWRLATVYLVLRDDRREAMTLWDEPLSAVFRHLLVRPEPDWPDAITGQHWAAYVSVTSYVGPVVVALVLLSVARGWRWWHTLVLIGGWLAIGSTHWYHPSYWLLDWPFFGSAHVVTRWRFLAMLGLGLAAGSVLARWRARGGGPGRRWPSALTLAIAADFLVLAHQQLPRAFSVRPEPRWFPGPPVAEIVNVGDGLGYPCVLRGYGVIRGYEPMLGYRRDAPTLRKAAGRARLSRRGVDGRGRDPAACPGAPTGWSSGSGRGRRSSSTRTPAHGGGSTAAPHSRAEDVPSRCSRSPPGPTRRAAWSCSIDPPGLRPGIALAPRRRRPADCGVAGPLPAIDHDAGPAIPHTAECPHNKCVHVFDILNGPKPPPGRGPAGRGRRYSEIFFRTPLANSWHHGQNQSVTPACKRDILIFFLRISLAMSGRENQNQSD